MTLHRGRPGPTAAGQCAWCWHGPERHDLDGQCVHPDCACTGWEPLLRRPEVRASYYSAAPITGGVVRTELMTYVGRCDRAGCRYSATDDDLQVVVDALQGHTVGEHTGQDRDDWPPREEADSSPPATT